MRSIIASLFTMVLLLISLAGAEEIKPSNNIDDIGRIVTIPNPPERIVSLSPSNTEILFALGLGKEVVGVTRYCNYPPEVESRKRNGTLEVVGGFKDPDIEMILSLRPDLVIAGGIHANNTVPNLEKMGIPTYVVKSNNLSSVLSSIKRIGKITGAENEASNLTNEMEARIKAISDKVGKLEKKKVLYIVWHNPVRTAGAGTFEDELIEKAGGVNIFHDLVGYAQVDPEAIAARNPEVIIACTGMGQGADKPFLWAKTDRSLNQTDARHKNQIFQVEGDTITRAGPRIIDGLEVFARFIHPEAC